MEKGDVVELIVGQNKKIKKGMRGTILEVYESRASFEVEFLNENHMSIQFKNQDSYTIPKNQLRIVKK